MDLINNTNEEDFNEVIAYITKKYNNKNLEYITLKKVLNLDWNFDVINQVEALNLGKIKIK